MLPVLLGFLIFVVLVLLAALRDPIGWGYLLSSRVDSVAEARLQEELLGMPAVYLIATVSAGAGVVVATEALGMLASLVLGTAVAVFLLGTMWDMRRRRGTLAVYIELRREELSFWPTGDVIEIPKLMFVTLNQPSPVIWLLGATALTVGAIVEFPQAGWYGALPLIVLAGAAVLAWVRQRESVWEPVAKRLRRASFIDGHGLEEYLQESLDFDPEVRLIRSEADAMVARIVSGV